ncbi:MAG: LruC domain-containing protein [Bacteroidaceae bacterium]
MNKIKAIKKMSFLFLLGAVSFLSCTKNSIIDNTTGTEETTPLGEIVVPNSFNWKASQTVNLKVIIDSQLGDTYNYYVSVYSENPIANPDAALFAKGLANATTPFTAVFGLPNYLTEIYVSQSVIDQSGKEIKYVKEVELTSGDLVCDFTNASTAAGAPSTRMLKAPKAPTAISVPSDAIVLSGSGAAAFSAGKTYVVPFGSSYTGALNWQDCTNVKLYVLGDFSPSNAQELNNNAVLYIDASGTYTVSSFELNSGATVENQGSFTATTLELHNSNSVFDNYGAVVAENMTTTPGIKLNNYCSITVLDLLDIQGNNDIEIGREAMIKAKDLKMNGSTISIDYHGILHVTGEANFVYGNNLDASDSSESLTALVHLNEIVAGWGGLHIKNNIQVYAEQGIAYSSKYVKLANKTTVVNAAEATLEIAASGCNGTGNNAPAINPTPSPTYPIWVENATVYTFLFEDLWPSYGDYDLNDCVFNVQISYELQDADYVSKLKVTTTLRGVGSRLNMALGLQLDDIAKSALSGVTDLGTTPRYLNGEVFSLDASGGEQGQTKVVVPITEDVHYALNGSKNYITVNTYKNVTPVASVVNEIELSFGASQVMQADLAIDQLNFFLVKDISNRTEVHLSGYNPTDKANMDLFNTSRDKSSGTYYTSETNYVWGVMVANAPGEEFRYPQEKVVITEAYPLFVQWVSSGNAEAKDWYLNANADLSKVY